MNFEFNIVDMFQVIVYIYLFIYCMSVLKHILLLFTLLLPPSYIDRFLILTE